MHFLVAYLRKGACHLSDLCYVTQKEPFEYTLAIINGKWKLRIIYVLACLKVVRYNQLQRNIEGITHKMLSTQLKELEESKIILRKEYPQIPPKVEYSLSQKGEQLLPMIQLMCEWGEKNRR